MKFCAKCIVQKFMGAMAPNDNTLSGCFKSVYKFYHHSEQDDAICWQNMELKWLQKSWKTAMAIGVVSTLL